MAPTVQTKISSPSTVIKIITDVTQLEKTDKDDFNDSTRKELEIIKNDRVHKESSSTQTSSSSTFLRKRKTINNAYYAHNILYKPNHQYSNMFLNRSNKNVNTMSQRIISAKFLRVKELQNELTESQKKISDLFEENRILRNIQKRQDSALRKYESKDSYLPQLLKSHEEEIRIVTLKYKKLRNAYNELESRNRRQYNEFVNVKERYKHLHQMAQDKNLLQREQLTKQIEELKAVINDLKNQIKLQSRRLDLEAKNYKYQFSVGYNKQKLLQEQLKQSQDTAQNLQITLKDKERYMANCKMNQQFINKMNQLKFKLSSNSLLKPIRLCSDREENFKSPAKLTLNEEKNNENVQNENFTNNSTQNSIAKKIDLNSNRKSEFKKLEIFHGHHSYHTKENVSPNRHNCSPTRKICTETDYCTDNTNYADGKTDENNSDSNNNFKPDSFDIFVDDRGNISKNSEESLFTNGIDIKIENFGELETEESDGEKSDSNFKILDETMSWLELHEKIKLENKNIEFKLDQLCNSASNSDVKNNDPNIDVLPYNKKSALLSALQEIDLENSETSSVTDTNHVDNQDDISVKFNSKDTTYFKSLKKKS